MILRWWVPLALIAWSFVVALPAGGAPDRRCTAQHRCHRVVVADARLRRFVTRESIPGPDTVELRVWVRGKQLSSAQDGLRAAFMGDGTVVTARARRHASPLEFRYAATRRTRVRIAYWSHR
jgi:hypothetical protein